MIVKLGQELQRAVINLDFEFGRLLIVFANLEAALSLTAVAEAGDSP